MKVYIKSSSNNGYLYIFKHGIGPGTIPKDVTVIRSKDLPNYYTAVWLDRFLTADELKQYDIPSETEINKYLNWIGYCQKDGDVVPCDEVTASTKVTKDADLPTFKEFATTEWDVLNDGSKRLKLKDLFVYYGTDKEWNASDPGYWYEIRIGDKTYKESKKYSVKNRENCYKAMQNAVKKLLDSNAKAPADVEACSNVMASSDNWNIVDYDDQDEPRIYSKDIGEGQYICIENYGGSGLKNEWHISVESRDNNNIRELPDYFRDLDRAKSYAEDFVNDNINACGDIKASKTYHFSRYNGESYTTKPDGTKVLSRKVLQRNVLDMLEDNDKYMNLDFCDAEEITEKATAEELLAIYDEEMTSEEFEALYNRVFGVGACSDIKASSYTIPDKKLVFKDGKSYEFRYTSGEGDVFEPKSGSGNWWTSYIVTPDNRLLSWEFSGRYTPVDAVYGKDFWVEDNSVEGCGDIKASTSSERSELVSNYVDFMRCQLVYNGSLPRDFVYGLSLTQLRPLYNAWDSGDTKEYHRLLDEYGYDSYNVEGCYSIKASSDYQGRYSAGRLEDDGTEDFYMDTQFNSWDEACCWGLEHDCTHIYDRQSGKFLPIESSTNTKYFANMVSCSSDPELDDNFLVEGYYDEQRRGLAESYETSDISALNETINEYANKGYFLRVRNLTDGVIWDFSPDNWFDDIAKDGGAELFLW